MGTQYVKGMLEKLSSFERDYFLKQDKERQESYIVWLEEERYTPGELIMAEGSVIGTADNPHIWGGRLTAAGIAVSSEVKERYGYTSDYMMLQNDHALDYVTYLAAKHNTYIRKGTTLFGPQGDMGTQKLQSSSANWLPDWRGGKRLGYFDREDRGGKSSRERPFTVDKFTHSKMGSNDHEAWRKRGQKLEDLIVLAKEYGSYFRWHDGKVYPTGHVVGDTKLLLLCNRNTKINLSKGVLK